MNDSSIARPKARRFPSRRWNVFCGTRTNDSLTDITLLDLTRGIASFTDNDQRVANMGVTLRAAQHLWNALHAAGVRSLSGPPDWIAI